MTEDAPGASNTPLDADDDVFQARHLGECDSETVSVAEAARRLGLGEKAVKRAIQTGEIPAIHIGRRWLVLKAPLDAMLRGDRNRRNQM